MKRQFIHQTLHTNPQFAVTSSEIFQLETNSDAVIICEVGRHTIQTSPDFLQLHGRECNNTKIIMSSWEPLLLKNESTTQVKINILRKYKNTDYLHLCEEESSLVILR